MPAVLKGKSCSIQVHEGLKEFGDTWYMIWDGEEQCGVGSCYRLGEKWDLTLMLRETF